MKPTTPAPSESREIAQTVVDPQLASILLFSIYVLTLSDTEREVLRLLQVDGLDYRTAAKHLGVTPEDISRIAFLARRKLHERMGRTLGELA